MNYVKVIDLLSDNSKLSCSIDKLGMILRNSKHKGESKVEDIKVLLDKIESKDTEGYRTKLISLLDQHVKNNVIE
ncbi:MAG: DUF3520 domain-containing protein [Saprospiraceae bacterium]|nr:DUF3520 domain-containing protein [Saprospiraceae bacterium]